MDIGNGYATGTDYNIRVPAHNHNADSFNEKHKEDSVVGSFIADWLYSLAALNKGGLCRTL